MTMMNGGNTMPINKTLANALRKKYGDKKAKEIYYAMENEGKPPFKKGLATAEKEKHTQKTFPKRKLKKKK
jgi:hypothetical protein